MAETLLELASPATSAAAETTERTEIPDHPTSEEETVSNNSNYYIRSENIIRPATFNFTMPLEVSDKILRSIHTYDGNLFLLPLFTNMLKELHNTFCSTEENARINNWVLIQNVIKNLEGEAKLVIARHPISNLLDIVKILENNFTDKRSVAILEDELANMKQGKDDPLEFLNKIVEKQTHIIAKYKIDPYYSRNHLIHTDALEKRALNTLRKGLNPPLNALLATMQPKTIDEARSMLQNDLQIISHTNVNPFKFPQKTFEQKPRNNFQNYRPQYNNFSPPSNYNPRSNYFQPQTRPHFGNSSQWRNPQHQNFYQRNSNQNQNFQNFQPRYPNNDTSMRTVSHFNKNPTNFKKFVSPYEVTHIQNNERIQDLEQKIDKLSESFHNFLEPSLNPVESPPNQSSLN